MNFRQIFEQEIRTLCQENLSKLDYVQEYLLNPGKQFRPQLYLDYVQAHRNLTDSDYKIATGLEILHLFFLVHDDIMDGDQLRRDKPTIHAYYSKQFGQEKANGLGILVGDLLFSRSLKLLTLNLSNQSAIPTIFEVIDITAKGQLEEYFLTPSNLPETSQILSYYEHKTALYSIYLPLALGYFSTNTQSNPQIIQQLQTFSKHLGVAFQIHDDLIEFKLQKKRSNQAVCADVMRGKITPILSYILKNTSPEITSQWITEWQNNNFTKTSHDQILNSEHALSAIAFNQSIINENLEQSQVYLQKLQLSKLPSIILLQSLLKPSS